ncbi:hypothetical protein EYF80_052228 [Liparis tanakae]|uniref:Uncharacterized protein n=1 Tax=Liparis tanakae TaxID=230148 RepID=A0A4Z2F8X4_9TELE|nr:hypothetical protein EYF80_052228 [Liparis tanakae]
MPSRNITTDIVFLSKKTVNQAAVKYAKRFPALVSSPFEDTKDAVTAVSQRDCVFVLGHLFPVFRAQRLLQAYHIASRPLARAPPPGNDAASSPRSSAGQASPIPADLREEMGGKQ